MIFPALLSVLLAMRCAIRAGSVLFTPFADAVQEMKDATEKKVRRLHSAQLPSPPWTMITNTEANEIMN